MDHTLRNCIGGMGEKICLWSCFVISALMNIGLFSWTVPKGTLDSALMIRSSVILLRRTYQHQTNWK